MSQYVRNLVEDEMCLFSQEPISDKPRKRRPRVDPNKLDLNNLTGEENVSVINRETGKKVKFMFKELFEN